MGMKIHEYVTVTLIESLAALKRGNTYKVVKFILKHKLVIHMNKQ
jgi:RIO-like serine/threonine protein kinase